MSERIVSFLGSLFPLYDMDYEARPWSARQLTTGVAIQSVDESNFDEERGLVSMQWPGQGEPWVVEGSFIATEALVRYVDLHGYGRTERERQRELQRMSEHFAFKTGAATYPSWENEDSEVFLLAGKLLRSAGKEVATSLLKSALGLP